MTEDLDFEELRRQALMEWRIANDPAFAHLREPEPDVEPEPEPEPQVSEDPWQMTRQEERSLLEYGTLADWAQDLLRRSLLEDDHDATSDIYQGAGMIRNDMGIWDYPDDHVHTPQEGPEEEIEEEEDEADFESLTPEQLEKLMQEELKKYREKTGRF